MAEEVDDRPFPTTHWSQVALAGLRGEEGRRRALGDLLRRYLPALRAHLVIQCGIPADRADDLLQAFVADKVLEEELIARADRRKGKFRTFLLAALHNFVLDQGRRESARKRSPERAPQSLDGIDPPVLDAPSRALDVAWAREVLAAAVEGLRAECFGSGRAEVWAVFEARLLGPILGGSAVVPYADLVARLAFRSAAQASNALITAKRQFVRHLRAVIGQYADDESEIDEEIAALRAALADPGQRPAPEMRTP